MDLEALRKLPPEDQQVFLLGRIAAETTSMEAALRFVHAALRGKYEIDAFLDAPIFASAIVKSCKELLRDHPALSDEARKATSSAVTAASTAYARRNRFAHDMLRARLLEDGWELARLTRQAEEAPTAQPTSFDDMVGLVLDLVTVKYRLRGCAMYVLNGGWEALALGEVTGCWDGTANTSR